MAEVAGAAIDKPSVQGKTFDAGDWLICNGSAAGWARIDTADSGGGGGASRLEDLTDVNVSDKQAGALLQYQADGYWKSVFAIDAGTF